MEKRLSPPPVAGTAEVLCDVRNHVAFVTLNRPAALNALSFGMIGALGKLFEKHAQDPNVHAVMLQGAGEKAFCAGGDIRELYQSVIDSGKLHREFFAAEYALDHLLHVYPKPYVAVMNGITMGGGMGLAQGSRLRLVGERTRIAMPEVGIGLFPDVGASYFLSRLPGSLGMYLALTGAQIRGADALYTGLADLYLESSSVASLAADLTALRWSDRHADDVRQLLDEHAAKEVPEPPLRALRGVIDRHFSADTVAGILDSLDAESTPAYAEWSKTTAALLRTRSPTMLTVTHRQLGCGKSMNLAECFRMELGMVEQCFDQGDFIEGVRALIIDKDNAPRWTPKQLQDVNPATVDAFFRSRWISADHPLAHLQ